MKTTTPNSFTIYTSDVPQTTFERQVFVAKFGEITKIASRLLDRNSNKAVRKSWNFESAATFVASISEAEQLKTEPIQSTMRANFVQNFIVDNNLNAAGLKAVRELMEAKPMLISVSLKKVLSSLFEQTNLEFETAEIATPAPDFANAWATLSIPKPEALTNGVYYPRIVENKTEQEWYETALECKMAVAIFGEAGTGKTSSAEAEAARRKVPFVVMECNTMITDEKTQGRYVPTGRGNELEWRYSEFATALGQESVILLNEASRMSPKANALFMRVLAEGELIIDTHKNEKITKHPRCLIIADANQNYRGTMNPDQAFLDRLLVKLEFQYDEAIEAKFIPSPSLLELAKEMRRAAATNGKFSTPVSTRLLKTFVSIAQKLSFRAAVYNFTNNFDLDERSSLKMMFSTYAEAIASELGAETEDFEL
jgi:hypothetical protein